MSFKFKLVAPESSNYATKMGITPERLQELAIKMSNVFLKLHSGDINNVAEAAKQFAEIADTPEELAFVMIKLGLYLGVVKGVSNEILNSI